MTLQFIAAGLVMIGVLVVIHEFGHFIVAKAFKIGVPVFSVGMGPRLFGFEYKGTDYRVSALPVGGYVQMAGADPFGEEDREGWVAPEENFMNKPVWQRLLVMAAGPAFNIALPFILFTAVLMLGEPQTDAIVGTVFPDTPAAEAGVEAGDRITAVNGQAVDVWLDVAVAIRGVDESVALTLQRDGSPVQVTLPAGAIAHTDDGFVDMQKVGMWASRTSSRIGVDSPASPAAQAGLRTGDAIVAIDGDEVSQLSVVRERLEQATGPVTLDVLRVDEEAEGEAREQKLTVTLDPQAASWSPRGGDQVTDRWGLVPVTLFVGKVADDSAASEAGVQSGDRIWSVDGRPVRSWGELVDLVAETVDEADEGATPRPLQLELVREGELVSLAFAPRMQREVVPSGVRYRPIMGILQFSSGYVPAPKVAKYYGFIEAVPRAAEEGWLTLKYTVGALANLFTGKLKMSESVGGPIQIFRMAGEGAQHGIFEYTKLIARISFSLGIVNLLPVPVLDGGQILFYAIEGIRGRPLSLEIREKVQMVGVLALVALMLVVSVMDVSRWLGS